MSVSEHDEPSFRDADTLTIAFFEVELELELLPISCEVTDDNNNNNKQ